MRRFFRTFTHRSHIQYAAVDDGDRRHALVLQWRAERTEVATLAVIPHEGIGRDRARRVAAAVARQLAADPALDPARLVADRLERARAEAGAATGLTVGAEALRA